LLLTAGQDRFVFASNFGEVKAPEVEMFTVDHQCHALTWDFRSPRNPNHTSLVNSAIENLRTFGFVGLVDEFDCCLRTLSNLFEEFPNHKELYLNRTLDRPGKDDVAPVAIKMIEELNVADIALYKKARKLFGTKVREVRFAPVDGGVRRFYSDSSEQELAHNSYNHRRGPPHWQESAAGFE
jgi:hypothetical protein